MILEVWGTDKVPLMIFAVFIQEGALEMFHAPIKKPICKWLYVADVGWGKQNGRTQS